MIPIAALSLPSAGPNVITSTFLTTMSNDVPIVSPSATQTFLDVPSRASWVVTFVRPRSSPTQVTVPTLSDFPEWEDREYRQAYLSASVEQGISWQIRANRKGRGWSQDELARLIGTQQSAVSRLEDPTYGSHSLETLISLAGAFDCALSVRFVSFSILAADTENLSPEALFAAPFSVESLSLGILHGNHTDT